MKRYWVSVHSNAPVFNMTDRDVAHTFGPFAGLEELARFEKSRPDSCYKGILPLYMPPGLEVRTPGAAAAPPGPAAVPAAAEKAPGAPLRGMRILVVDDGPDAVQALHELLEMEGAEVEVALTGEAALAQARKKPFDVVISDIAMPGMDGMALMRKLRVMPDHLKVAAIACSGFNRPQDVQRALEAGFDAHLSKPVGVRELVDTIQRLMQRDVS